MRLTFRPCPKAGKKPKRAPKPLKRSPIKKCKGSFKASDNGKRKQRRDPAGVLRWAMEKRLEKLADLSPAQLSLGAILRDGGVRFEYEKIWINGDVPVFSDIYLPDHHLTIEVDGKFHRGQARHDTQRAAWLARNHKVGTVRIWNGDVQSGLAGKRVREMLGFTT